MYRTVSSRPPQQRPNFTSRTHTSFWLKHVSHRRPPLEPKLVGRPPFRFLRDVVAEVIKQTEYLGGLYEPAEIKAEQPDKAAKMSFLQKAIDAHST